MVDVFLSYSHRDKALAETLYHIIEQRRSVFMDRRRLRPGAKWEPMLRMALQSARCVVVIWSKASVKSEWVRREAREGLMRDVLIPVCIHEVPIPAEFEQFQAADLVGWDGNDSDALRLVLGRIDEVIRLPSKTPDAVAEEWAGLVARLDAKVPHKLPGENLLLATWNVRGLGQLTPAWTASADDAPKRDKRAVLAIAEIISRFDIVMLTELRGMGEALRMVRDFLGDDWSLIFSEANVGAAGNIERVAFCFDTRRVLPSGLADRISPFGESDFLDVGALLVEPMYGATFRTRSPVRPLELTLVVLHLDYALGGEVNAEITATVSALATWLEAWSVSESKAGRAVVMLGDFNPDRRGGPLYDAIIDALSVPEGLHSLPRAVGSPGKGTFRSELLKFYDQLTWYGGDPEGPCATLRHRASGVFDFVGAVHNELSIRALSYRLSDHYPLWIEFSTPHK